MITVTTTASGFEDVMNSLVKLEKVGSRGSPKTMERLSEGICSSVKSRMEREIKFHHLPERGSNLRDSLYSYQLNGFHAGVTSGLFYAPFVENGTSEKITKSVRVLINPVSGTPVWRRIGVHKATQPKKYFQNGLDDFFSSGNINRIIKTQLVAEIL